MSRLLTPTAMGALRPKNRVFLAPLTRMRATGEASAGGGRRFLRARRTLRSTTLARRAPRRRS